MADWKRPGDFEERATEQAQEVAGDGGIQDIEEAFLSGALWAALLAEGRLAEDDD